MKYEFPWKVCDKAAFERSVAAAFPKGDWLARAIVEKFDSDIRVHRDGCSASKLANAEEQVWQYGPVLVRYRLLSVTQQVEVLSVTLSVTTMRNAIESVVKIFRQNPNATDDEILDRVIATGIEHTMAVQLVALLPLAYGRVTLTDGDVVFSDIYLCPGTKGQPDRKGRLSSLPLWADGLDFASRDSEPSFPIASRSSEVRVANAALLDGKKPSHLVWGPPVFLWPVDAFVVPGRAERTPPWWRRIWDAPAEHSVTFRERSVARVAFIIALLVGLLAVAIVVYYAASLLREIH
jgi:hypothetical protein